MPRGQEVADDLRLVIEVVASIPLPRIADCITTQVPREVIEAARRVKETLDANKGGKVSHTYVVSLPVVVTVHDNGAVSWDVDKTETVEAVRESCCRNIPPFGLTEQEEADLDTIRAAL